MLLILAMTYTMTSHVTNTCHDLHYATAVSQPLLQLTLICIFVFRLANDFSTCISNSMLSTLTLPESGQTLTTPCADQIRETQAVEQQFLGSLDRRKCVRSDSIWSNVCKNIVVEAFTSSTSSTTTSTTTSTTQSTTTHSQSFPESSTALPSVSTSPG